VTIGLSTRVDATRRVIGRLEANHVHIGKRKASVNVTMVACCSIVLVVTFVVVCPFSLFVLGSVLNIND